VVEGAVLGGCRWRVKMTMTSVNHSAVMALSARCVVNISLCIDLVKM